MKKITRSILSALIYREGEWITSDANIIEICNTATGTATRFVKKSRISMDTANLWGGAVELVALLWGALLRLISLKC